jgi:hypothetical protein
MDAAAIQNPLNLRTFEALLLLLQLHQTEQVDAAPKPQNFKTP